MSPMIYRYAFRIAAQFAPACDVLCLAILAAEGIHGKAQVLLDAAIWLDEKQRACVVDAGTLVGQTIARIFTSLLARQFGEDAFTVERGAKPGGQGKSQPSPRSA